MLKNTGRNIIPGQLRNLDLLQARIGEDSLRELMAFKAGERKDDPARQHGIHGPYEEATIRKTGRLPSDYYSSGDPEPWGLRIAESRSNLLWQSLSGLMDRHAEFGTAYMALALDQSLNGEDYAKELRKLNKNWGDFLEHSLAFNDHAHSAMGHTYARVSCPACSALTALAVRDSGMQSVFKSLLPLRPAERRQYLMEKGLTPLLDTMIPQLTPQGQEP